MDLCYIGLRNNSTVGFHKVSIYTDRWRIIDRSASEPTTKRGFHEVLYKQSP